MGNENLNVRCHLGYLGVERRMVLKLVLIGYELVYCFQLAQNSI
jgi:ABC-type iron transport system FetAB permease component